MFVSLFCTSSRLIAHGRNSIWIDFIMGDWFLGTSYLITYNSIINNSNRHILWAHIDFIALFNRKVMFILSDLHWILLSKSIRNCHRKLILNLARVHSLGLGLVGTWLPVFVLTDLKLTCRTQIFFIIMYSCKSTDCLKKECHLGV